MENVAKSDKVENVATGGGTVGKVGKSGSRLTYFYEPLYMTVTCSEFTFGVQDYGLFWEMTSGCFPYPAPVGSTLDTCYVSLRRLFGFRMQKNCGVSAVAVLYGRRYFLSRCRG